MNTSYEMLESWYETMKGEKELSLKEAKELVQSIEKCDSLKEKELLQEKLLRGTIGVLYSFIKDNGILMLSNTGYVEVEDLLSSLTLAWAEDLQDKISEVGRYSTLFSRDYFESVAEKLGVENLADSLKLWDCSYLGALGTYYRDKDNDVEVSPYFYSVFSIGPSMTDEQKEKTIDLVERGYQLYREHSFINSDNTALLGFYGMIFTSIIVKEGRYDRCDTLEFADDVIARIDVSDIVLGSKKITDIQRRVLFEKYGFDGKGEKDFCDMAKDYSVGRARIGQVAAKGLRNLRSDAKVRKYNKN